MNNLVRASENVFQRNEVEEGNRFNIDKLVIMSSLRIENR